MGTDMGFEEVVVQNEQWEGFDKDVAVVVDKVKRRVLGEQNLPASCLFVEGTDPSWMPSPP
jgi:hypothetical protein